MEQLRRQVKTSMNDYYPASMNLANEKMSGKQKFMVSIKSPLMGGKQKKEINIISGEVGLA